MTRMLRVGEAEVYPQENLIRRNGRQIRMSPRGMDVLVFLVQRARDTVSAEIILDRVWGNAYVSDNAVHKVMSEIRHALGDDSRQARYIRTVHKRGYQLVAPVERCPEGTSSLRSIAVLPFEDLTGDPRRKYLVTGLHEEVVAALAKIRSLDVRSRATVRHLEHADVSIQKVASELGVGTIVEATVSGDARHLRVTVQLVDCALDTHLWCESFTRPCDDILGVQNELAVEIARSVGATLTADDRTRLACSPTTNPAAYDAYLRGHHARSVFLPGSMDEAVFHYERALELDCRFAGAFAALSATLYMHGANIGGPPAHELMPKAKAAASRAIELDDSLADAHFALANVLFSYEWNWTGAELELDRARRLQDATDPVLVGFHANFLAAMGRADEALALSREALTQAPREPVVQANLVFVHDILGQHQQALERAIRGIELAPYSFLAHSVLIYVAQAVDEWDCAAEARARTWELLGLSDRANGVRAAYGSGGRRAFAQQCLEQSMCSPHSCGHLPYLVELGRIDDAFDRLELAMAARDPYLVFMRGHSFFPRALRADRRFHSFVRRVGLPV